MPIEIITTGDGSHSLLNTDLDETYHSRHGAVQESKHVFIKNGLDFFYDRRSQNSIEIFEMGFGTGLNAFLTALWADEKRLNVSFTSLELFPLQKNIYENLNYTPLPAEANLFRSLHECQWETVNALTTTFKLNKKKGELAVTDFQPNSFDIVFYDAFAPSKQPELWNFDIISKVASWMRPNGIFVTYCAKGQLKRDLKTAGLEVETLSGPPGKKEMVRALKF